MNVVLNELLWSMEYQEQLCMTDIREEFSTGLILVHSHKAEEAELRDFVVVVGQIGYGKPEDKSMTLPKQSLVIKGF